MNRVLAIGQKHDAPLAPILHDGIGLGYSHVARCSTRRHLIETVMRASAVRPIDLLDIFDHGAPGKMAIGDETLVDLSNPDAQPDIAVFQSFHHYLSPTAHVRLLGCNTGAGLAGRKLLVKLAATLGGQRVVFGTIERVQPFHFGPDGFQLIDEMLYSNVAALDSEAPAIGKRLDSIFGFKVPLLSRP